MFRVMYSICAPPGPHSDERSSWWKRIVQRFNCSGEKSYHCLPVVWRTKRSSQNQRTSASEENVKTKVQRDGWHTVQGFTEQGVIPEEVKKDERPPFQFVSSITLSIKLYIYFTTRDWCYIISRCPGICCLSTRANEKRGKKRDEWHPD